MKKLAVISFVLTALVALPPRGATTPPNPADVEGQGILACGACIGSGAAAAATGLGAFYSAIMAAGDGTLADACASACTF
jgi:hypothetical protein